MFDRRRYDEAIKRMDEAPTRSEYFAGLCSLAEAQGRVPNLLNVARAFGLPPPDKEALDRFGDDVIYGRIPMGTTAAEVRERFYGAGAQPRSRPGVSAERSAAPARSPNGSGSVDGPWTDTEDDLSAEHDTERAWSDTTIKLLPRVVARIEREIREAQWAFDAGVETGGWLYAHFVPDAKEVTITAATGPGPSAEHHEDRVRLSHPRELESERGSAALLVGNWHTHPDQWKGSPTDQASTADEEAWGSFLQKLASCSSPWVGLVFTPNGSMGWTTPLFYGYLTHKNEHGVVVCEQATVAEAEIPRP